ncbi:hypothetical protein T552_03100 [Pneumocystis carinii B80]|uniref:RNA polymerase II subunit B1 CTD phosphatase RPAP2 homolog n=1 Tax=Pneumocystis carinii (strain B80) TaxID=1408658 RepID=A0A0W4ZD01_PNEC8|nr:hypothetical protein T552_03100 [Pneumocystis carinii B80]KTW26209.1 hypothetical protein T552_03100 [Pneumocystis carinii B80]
MSELQIMSLLLRPVDPQTLRSLGSKLKPQDYENVLLERNLEKFCGYPLCHNPPRDEKAPYRILYSKRKIYDQRSLLRFCSTDCFKRSAFFAAQLSPEPFWLRDSNDMNICLLEESLGSEGPSVDGEGVDISVDAVDSDLNRNNKPGIKTPIHSHVSERTRSCVFDIGISNTSFPIVERSLTMKTNVVEKFPDSEHYECIEGFVAPAGKWQS